MDSTVVRKIREALRMSQQEFAHELGMSIGSVRSYEAGTNLSEGALEKLKSLAARKMLPDFALALDSRDFAVREVFDPGKRVRLPRVPAGQDLGDVLHQMMDEVLESGNVEAIVALESVLHLCVSRVTSAISQAGKSEPRHGLGGKG